MALGSGRGCKITGLFIIGGLFMLRKAYLLLWLALLSPLVQAQTVQFDSAAYNINEDAGTVTITVTISEAPDNIIKVDYSASGGDAMEGMDYTVEGSGTLRWELFDSAPKTFTVTIIDDAYFEGDETFNLMLSNPTGGATIGSPDTAEVTIIDNDESSGPTLQFSKPMYEVDEDAGTVTITVTISEMPEDIITVDYSATGGNATEGEDYTSKSGILRWELFDDSDKTFTVQIKDDTEIEGNETFNLTLENPDGAKLGDPNTAVVTIVDDETSPPPGILQFSSPQYQFDEGDGIVNIPVERIGGSLGVVSVKCVSFDGSAKAGKDYIETSNVLEWGHGDDNDKSCQVIIIDDTEEEGNETFGLKLEEATGGATIGDPSTTGVIIVDNDPLPHGVLQFSSATYSAEEDEGSVTLIVTRVDGSNGEISVSYESSDGTTTEWYDYIPVSGNLVWKDGNLDDKRITIGIIDDTEIEGNETFNLKLKKPTGGAVLGNPKKAVVTIIDDEVPPAGTLQFSKADYSVDEDGGSVKIIVTRKDGSSGAVSVEFNTADDSAKAGKDYVDTSGITLNWGDDDDSDKTLNISILDDNILESDETFSLTLTNATGGATIGDPDTAVVTIVDDEVESKPGTLQFSSATYSVDENGGSVVITVTRVSGKDGAVSVKAVTSDGTAEKNKDYKKTTKKLKWGNGDDSAKAFIVTILDDGLFEGNETFSLNLKNATGGATIGDPDTVVVTIVDDDESIEPGTLQFSSDTYYVGENGGSVAITVIRVDGSDGAASVKVVTGNGTAKKNKDYEKTTETLKWNDGYGGTKTFNVNILDDAKVEGDETFKLKLKKAKGAKLGNPKKVEVIIIDDDKSSVNCDDVTDTVCPVLSVLQFSESTYSVNENKGTVTLTVIRTGSSEGEVSVVCVTSDESATAGDDYDGSFETLIWADGDSKDKGCQIDILDDSNLEGSETFIVSIGRPDGAELGALNTVTVTILDNE
jgi:ribosomal protein L35AE/L33A